MTSSVEIVEFDHNIIEHLAVRIAGHHNRPAYALTLPAAAGAFKLPYSGIGVLLGYSVMVPAAGTGVFQLFDGQDATGQLLANEQIPATNGITQWFGPGGVVISSGLTVVLSAATLGVVWVRTAGHPAVN